MGSYETLRLERFPDDRRAFGQPHGPASSGSSNAAGWHEFGRQLLPVIAQQGVDFTMRFVADSVDLGAKLLPRRCRILIEQRLNPVMMLLK